KSRHIIPTSFFPPVRRTQEGFALRSSAQRRISSWSVRGREDAELCAIKILLKKVPFRRAKPYDASQDSQVGAANYSAHDNPVLPRRTHSVAQPGARDGESFRSRKELLR